MSILCCLGKKIEEGKEEERKEERKEGGKNEKKKKPNSEITVKSKKGKKRQIQRQTN